MSVSNMGMFNTMETFLSLKERLRDAGVPSASIALLDSPSSQAAAHVISINDTEDTETIYQACSISKAITALGVAKLVDQGVISYETKVVDHVPKEIWSVIVDSKTEHLMDYVTVGHLVSHRSGLSQHGFPGYAGTQTPSYQEILAGKAPANTPRMKFLSIPGSQCCYSGGGFLVLQILLEHITGKGFVELIDETVLKPLGMSRSRYGDLPADEKNRAKAYATSEVLGTENGRGYFYFTELAAAGLWTTPSDLVRATAAIQSSLHGQGEFLSQATAKKLLTPTSPADMDGETFGLGWIVDDTFFAHSGDNDPGYTTYFISAHGLPNSTAKPLPAHLREVGQMSLAIMTNSVLGWGTIRKLTGAIFGINRWPLYPSLPSFGTMANIIPYESPEGVAISPDWKHFIGHWAAAGLEYEIFEHGGKPYVLVQGIEVPMRLIPGATTWQVVGEPRERFVFIVEGLEMAFWMRFKEDGEKEIELVQEGNTVLRPV